MDVDRDRRTARLAEVARPQLGVFTRKQAIAAGFRPGEIQRLLARGAWHAHHPGVYSHASLPHTWEVRLMAALLALGDGAVAGRLAAARLWRLPDLDRIARVEALMQRRKLPRLEGVTVIGTDDLPPEDVTMVGPFRVTSLTRTVVDLASLVGDRESKRASRQRAARRASADRPSGGAAIRRPHPPVLAPRQFLEAAADGYRRALTSPEQLAACASRRPRLAGMRALRDVLAVLDTAYADCWSVAEIRLHAILRGGGITGYRLNVRVRLSSGRTVVFDVLFDELGLALEVDSDRHHGAVTARERDARRDAEAAADGYLVRRIPVALLRDPDAVLALVRDAVAEARTRAA